MIDNRKYHTPPTLNMEHEQINYSNKKMYLFNDTHHDIGQVYDEFG